MAKEASKDNATDNDVTDVDSASESLLGLLTEHGLDVFDEEDGSATEEDGESQSDDDEEIEESEDDGDGVEEDEDGESDDDGEEEEEDDGDEDVDEDEEEERKPQPKTFEVKVAGKVEKVTLDELKLGYSRTSDYQRKTQALAEERKALGQEQAAVRAERAEYTERLVALEEALEAALPAEPDWDALREEDPQAYAVEFANYQRKQKQIEKVAAERRKAEEKLLEDAQKEYVQTLREQSVELLKQIPEWSDKEKMTTERTKLTAYAESLGFSREQLATITDARLIVMLRKAMLFDAGKAAVGKGKKKGKPAVKTLKPGGRGVKKPQGTKKAQRDAMKRLRRSGRVDDAAAAFMEMDFD